MFKHFLVTPFNLLRFPMGVGEQEKWLEWTRRRIELFKSYCLPSLLNQSNKNFKWLLYWDVNTPDEFKSFADSVVEYGFIEVRYEDGFDNFKKNYPKYIKEQSTDVDWVMISRIDNDDCFEKDAISTIQCNFKPQNEFLISLASGYTLNEESKILSHYFYPMSPFITIIEDCHKDNLLGVYCKPHSSWQELRLFMSKEILGLNKKSKFILEKPYWMQVVHDENVSNSFNRGVPVLKSLRLDNFGVRIKTQKQSLKNITSYIDYIMWKRYFKASVVRLLKR